MRFHFSVFVIATFIATASHGQNVYLDEIYGDGVHAFFRGEVAESQAQFDRAIRHGSRDPRVYYFRAITQLCSGDQFQAEADIRTAVTYELQGRGTYDVGRALERIQGPQRLELEQIRQLVRLELRGRPRLGPYDTENRIGPSQRPDLPLDNAPNLPDSPFRLESEGAIDSSDLDLDRPPVDRTTPETPAEPNPQEAKPDPFADDDSSALERPTDAPLPQQPAESAPNNQAPVEEAPADDPFADDPFATEDDSPF